MVNVTCRRCGGYGIIQLKGETSWSKCRDCKGDGKIVMKGKYLTNEHLKQWEVSKEDKQ